ncbi:MAG: orotidine-5'-phosphate decarboxylase [Alphaproteobacteria bacterium]|nr:orotidine-5'-phosphate decarboxylase [Alphaproteobacteria bacterium]
MLPLPASAQARLIAALDTTETAQAVSWARALAGRVGLVKVGMEFFTARGPEGFAAVAACGAPMFLDMKFHDIPNTVAGGVRAAALLGASMVTLHASGGPAMMAAAREAAQAGARAAGKPRPMLLAVTVLTSLSAEDMEAVGQPDSPTTQVVRLARLAAEAGIDAIVCSPHEIGAIRAALGRRVALVVPGIRPAGSAMGDQKRATTPGEAVRAGADWLVMGRPLTQAADPAAAAAAIAAEVAGASAAVA